MIRRAVRALIATLATFALALGFITVAPLRALEWVCDRLAEALDRVDPLRVYA